MAAMIVNGSERNGQSLYITFQTCFLNKLRFIWTSGFREEDFGKLTNQKQELSIAAMFVNVSERNNLDRGPSINVLIPLAKRYQWRRLKYSNLTDDGRQQMSTPHIAIDRVN